MISFKNINDGDAGQGVWCAKLRTQIPFENTQYTENMIMSPKSTVELLRDNLMRQEEFLQCFDPNVTESALALIRIYPLLLFSECVAPSCRMTRLSSKVREMQEALLLNQMIVNNVDAACSIGCGGLFSDMVLLTRFLHSGDTFTLYLCDEWRDYFEYGGVLCKDTGDLLMRPESYNGPMDDKATSRARWMTILTLRLSTFLSWFEHKEITMNLIIAETGSALSTYFSQTSVMLPQITYGVDLMDDFAVFALSSFYQCSLVLPNSIGYVVSYANGSVYMDLFRTGSISMHSKYAMIQDKAKDKEGWTGGFDVILEELITLRKNTCESRLITQEPMVPMTELLYGVECFLILLNQNKKVIGKRVVKAGFALGAMLALYRFMRK